MPEEIAPRVYLFKGKGYSCNAYFLQGEKMALIDSGLKSNEENLIEGLSELALKPEDIELVLHSHGHVDHFSADGIFTQAKICMHQADAELVGKKHAGKTCEGYFPFDETFYPKIDYFLQDGETIDLGEIKLRVIHTPGHSPGSLCFHEEKNKLLFSGDTLFAGSVGRTDLMGSDKKALKESLQKLSEIDIKLLLPGHGLILKGNQTQNLLNCMKLLE